MNITVNYNKGNCNFSLRQKKQFLFVHKKQSHFTSLHHLVIIQYSTVTASVCRDSPQHTCLSQQLFIQTNYKNHMHNFSPPSSSFSNTPQRTRLSLRFQTASKLKNEKRPYMCVCFFASPLIHPNLHQPGAKQDTMLHTWSKHPLIAY